MIVLMNPRLMTNMTPTIPEMGRMAWSDPAKGGPMLAKIPLNR